MWTLELYCHGPMYLSVVILLVVANLFSVTTSCDVNGDYSTDSSSLFQELMCNFERSSSEWSVGRVTFFPRGFADVQVTCTTSDGDTELYAKLYRNLKSNRHIKIQQSAVDPDMINGANCSIKGCYESDSFNLFKIPPSSCIVDFDECSEATRYCPSEAECMNAPRGSYTCVCPAGHTFNNTLSLCLDFDECKTNDSICAGYGPNTVCMNTDGSYECGCTHGHRNNGTFCENIDECTEGTHNCSSNAKCTDTDGSYYCNCTEGFQGNGQFCEVLTDDSAILAGLVSTLAALSLVLLVVMIVFFTLCTAFIKIQRRIDNSTPKLKPQKSTIPTTRQESNYVSTV